MYSNVYDGQIRISAFISGQIRTKNFFEYLKTFLCFLFLRGQYLSREIQEEASFLFYGKESRFCDRSLPKSEGVNERLRKERKPKPQNSARAVFPCRMAPV